MKILCVEPTALYQQLLGHLFTELGVSATFMDKAQPALELFAKQPFDLLCTAYQLHCMTGVQLIESARENGFKEGPAVLLSADTSAEFVSECLHRGVTEVLGKQDFQGVERTLRNIISRYTQKRSGKVLVVEDDASIAGFMVKLLSDKGYEVPRCESGEEAIALLESNTVDLVITDMVLSGKITGMGLLNWVRANKGGKESLPVLAVSAGSDKSRKVEMLYQGANDYVEKPFVPEELVARVSNLMSTKQLFDRVRLQQEEMIVMATTDQLTGLSNRHSILDIADKYLCEAERKSYPLSLLVVDLDHFKSINDTYGHSAGDAVLSETGRAMQALFRGEDVVARFGGEEFAILMHRCNLQDAQLKAQTLCSHIEGLKPGGLSVTASIGVAELSLLREKSFDGLFQAADEAVYTAKREGRNRVCIHDGTQMVAA
ncbi:MAG: diguanylate cyclase [Gammaproteobacteria bacterium]|nr:diguanylate cyclase [Gammaproteobacteria bacterium]MDH5799615.1 diguanylate cyclase [Gammaproteobacteria bacterium]